MMEFYAPKGQKEHKEFRESGGRIYSLPPKWTTKEWSEWKWEKREMAIEDVPQNAMYEGYCNPWNLPMEEGDTNYMGNESQRYIRHQGRNISPRLDEKAVRSSDRIGHLWNARSLFALWEAAR